MQNHLQTQRQLLFDLTANYLEPLPDVFSRLAYLAGLRHPATGKYTHDRLAMVYAPAQIDQVLAKCHEELFERLLEMPLSGQEKDLRKFLNSLPGTFEDNVRKYRNGAEEWVQGSLRNIARPTTLPTTSASSGVRQASGAQRESVCGCMIRRDLSFWNQPQR